MKRIPLIVALVGGILSAAVAGLLLLATNGTPLRLQAGSAPAGTGTKTIHLAQLSAPAGAMAWAVAFSEQMALLPPGVSAQASSLPDAPNGNLPGSVFQGPISTPGNNRKVLPGTGPADRTRTPGGKPAPPKGKQQKPQPPRHQQHGPGHQQHGPGHQDHGHGPPPGHGGPPPHKR